MKYFNKVMKDTINQNLIELGNIPVIIANIEKTEFVYPPLKTTLMTHFKQRKIILKEEIKNCQDYLKNND
jgi:hypothetical protein